MESERPSVFRGSAGEVVRGFVDLGTLFTVIPVLVMMVIIGLVAGLVVKVVGLSAPFAAFIMVVSASPIVGRFALAARNGQLDAGFFAVNLEKGAVMAFVLRHAALTICWGLPVTIAAHLLIGGMSSSFGFMDGLRGWAGLGLLVLFVVALVAQLISLLIATKADSVSQVVSADAWRWALVERRADLVPLVASLFGGLMVFALFVWPVVGVLALLLVKAPKLAAAVGIYGYAAPMLAAPVLLGRLCGAFVFGEESIETPAHNPMPRTGPTPPVVNLRPIASAGPEAVAQSARRLDVKQALDSLRVKAASDPATALKEAQILREAHPVNPLVAVELALLLRQHGQAEEALAASAAAIKVALTSGTAPVAIEMWKTCGDDRHQLDLDPGTLESLGRHLTTRKELEDAAWCFRTMKDRGGDGLRVQKGLIGVADTIARDGNARGAVQLYQLILRDFPDSTLRDYIEGTVSALQRKSAASRN
jgi:hypothetical protein